VVFDLDAESGNFSARAFRVAETIEHDVRALLRRGLGNSKADATGGPRDKRGFAFEHDDDLRMN